MHSLICMLPFIVYFLNLAALGLAAPNYLDNFYGALNSSTTSYFASSIVHNYSHSLPFSNSTTPDQLARIFGGKPASLSLQQHVVFLMIRKGNNKSSVCSGTFISKVLILTAAHCLLESSVDGLRFSSSSQSIFEQHKSKSVFSKNIAVFSRQNPMINGPGSFQFAKYIHIHKQFDVQNARADLAIIGIEKPFDPPTRSVFLPSLYNPKSPPPNKFLWTTGYGRLSQLSNEAAAKQSSWSNYKLEEILTRRRDANTFCIPRSANTEANRELRKISDLFFCTFPEKADSGSCEGDSGGPLYEKWNDGRILQLGVKSFQEGKNCGMPSVASWFIKLVVYEKDIRMFMKYKTFRWKRIL